MSGKSCLTCSCHFSHNVTDASIEIVLSSSWIFSACSDDLASSSWLFLAHLWEILLCPFSILPFCYFLQNKSVRERVGALANRRESLSTLAQRGTVGSHPAGLATTSGS